MNKTRVKNAFTLIELIIVVILLFTTMYLFVFSSSNFDVKKRNNIFSLDSLKENLIKIPFDRTISFVCIEDNFDCFIEIDGNIKKDKKITNVFNTKPEVYEFNSSQIQMDFEPIEIDDIDYDVVFRYEINSDYKVNELILDTLEDNVYVYNSIYNKARVFESISDAFEVFEKNKLEVRDAF